jgi:thiamine transport system ATP-binding protein
VLSLRQISVVYDAVEVLRCVDLTVQEGERVAILGPSGSGKSTLLRVVAGLQVPVSGEVWIAGENATATPAHRRGVGLMFQSHALFPHLTVGENVSFGLRMQGVPRREAMRRVGELLDLVGLPRTGPRAVATLSGGEQQRVALARALAPRPRLLMLDEPFGQLDRVLRDRLVEEVRAVCREQGTTLLAVTHDHREAFALGERLVVLRDGHVVQEGIPQEVWARPSSEFVARFLGFTNIARAEVRNGAARTPWGAVAVAAKEGPRPVLVRPAGVILDPEGAGEATVVDLRFRGDYVVFQLFGAGIPSLEGHCRAAEAPLNGATVRYRLDPSETVVLDGE